LLPTRQLAYGWLEPSSMQMKVSEVVGLWR
jgi:hypothetical protein